MKTIFYVLILFLNNFNMGRKSKDFWVTAVKSPKMGPDKHAPLASYILFQIWEMLVSWVWPILRGLS